MANTQSSPQRTTSTAREQLDVGLRLLEAIVGTLPLALLASAALVRTLPLSEDARFAIGFATAIPIWLTAMCFAFLARSGVRAWVVCLGLSALSAALSYGGLATLSLG